MEKMIWIISGLLVIAVAAAAIIYVAAVGLSSGRKYPAHHAVPPGAAVRSADGEIHGHGQGGELGKGGEFDG